MREHGLTKPTSTGCTTQSHHPCFATYPQPICPRTAGDCHPGCVSAPLILADAAYPPQPWLMKSYQVGGRGASDCHTRTDLQLPAKQMLHERRVCLWAPESPLEVDIEPENITAFIVATCVQRCCLACLQQ